MRYLISLALFGLLAGAAMADPDSRPWSTVQKIDEAHGNSSEINTKDLDGCPILSPDGLSLYMASNRTGSVKLDIWVARRSGRGNPFGAPERLPAPVNSDADDFCPTPLSGGRLLFVSRRVTPESCGMGDIYLTRHHPRRGWSDPEHFACAPHGPNSELDEQGPSLVEFGADDEGGRADDGPVTGMLFFSRSSPSVPGDLFVSHDLGPATAITELNSAGNDIQPNVRRNGREIVFSSNHGHPGALGGQDVYTATRASIDDPWSAPVNVGGPVNTSDNETRPSLSRDARTLLFGRSPGPEGSSDIFYSTR